jgi:YesN/AraC family two-component response regulator
VAHAPWMVKAPAAPSTDGAVLATAVAPRCDNARRCAKPPSSVTDRWVRCVVAKNFTTLGQLHDGMQKALLHLSDHYHEPLSLGHMAKLSHVSPSHLSYLFKTSVGTTFKPFLGRVRVEKAKDILSTNGRQRITDVALSVGFTDLSHFEKLFRRLVGASPRAFRRSIAAPATHFDA